ncbi:MAG: segregation and condensation protein [Actinomycetota bacterium]|nr:segregation and condensation protein [Actinomycetota bacterium]
MGYEVQTPVFEGPFDLLLHLILREEVDLFEVSLSLIVDRYLAEVARLERVDLEVATEFLLIAATLIDLKARRLLPGRDDLDLDDELSRWDERDYLIARLLECKTFQDASRHLLQTMQVAALSLPRVAGPEEPFRSLAPDPLERISPDELAAAARAGLTPKPSPEVRTDHVAPVRASVREAIETVLALLPASGAVSFRDLVYGSGERLEIVVRFLACLELYKQGLVDLEQATTFGELMVRPLAIGERADVDLTLAGEWDDDGPMVIEPATADIREDSVEEVAAT